MLWVLTASRFVRLNTSCVAPLGEARLGRSDCCRFTSNLLPLLPWKDGLCNGYDKWVLGHEDAHHQLTGKVGMSVLTKGLAMDFVRQGRKEMAITSIWPASVSYLTIRLAA
jgi:hypothetical protein